MSIRAAIQLLMIAVTSCSPKSQAVWPDSGASLPPEDSPDATIVRQDAAIERHIGDCSTIATGDRWQDITPLEVDETLEWRVTNVVADPINLGTVYMGSEHRGIFKSTDCGATWIKINTGRNGSILDEGLNWALLIDPVEPNVLYAGSAYSTNNGLFKSTNGGVDWDPLWTPGTIVYETVEYSFLQSIAMDPTDHQHLIVTFHATCRGFSGCMGESTDAGVTWRLFETPLPWGEGASAFLLGPTTIIWATLQNGAYLSNDSGANWERIGPGNNGSVYRTGDGTYYVGSDYGIQRSRDGQHWEVIPDSPHVYGIVGDGTRMIAALRYPTDEQPYFTSLESDGASWARLASPPMTHGAVFFASDSAHHVHYAASTHSGLWRIGSTP